MVRELDDFSRKTAELIANRAGAICSNPACKALTRGPSGEDDTLSVGEAAHIYGARPGSARFDPKMLAADRSSLSNAIWLCRNCHRQADQDEGKFTAILLFEWRRRHELSISEKVGVTAAHLSRKATSHLIEPLTADSYLAQQIALDRSPAWEYRLTAELLRTRIAPVLQRWRSLEKGLHVQRIERVSQEASFAWIQDRLAEMGQIGPAFSGLVNGEFQESWGEPGEPGSIPAIAEVCRIFVETATFLVDFEQRVRFSRVSDEFDELRMLLIGILGRQLNEAARLPEFLSSLFSDGEIVEGTYNLSIVFDLPDSWEDEWSSAMDRVTARILDRQ